MRAKYIVMAAVLSATACTDTNQFDAVQPTGNELVVTAKLVSSSEWKTRSGASSQAQGIEYGQSTESSDGQFFISATRQEWTAEQEQNPADKPITRGTPITSVSGIAQMRVNVVHTGEGNWTAASAITSAVTANKSGNGYTTSPIYNWVVDPMAKTSLFAYSPVASSSANGLTENGNNKIDYTVPTAVANQPDLCTATPKIDIVNNDGTQQIQSFALSHQLTAVGFSMLGWNLKITKITVSGVAVKGTLTMNTDGTTSWTTSDIDSRDVGVTQSSFEHNHNNDYANITNSDGYLMMIPQTLTDAATVTITYESTGDGSASGTTTAKLKDLGVTWAAGDKITYNIRLKTAPAITSGDMKIDNPKAGYTTSVPLTVFTEGSDILTFTWDKSWLKIHHGGPIDGNPGSVGYMSPWSVTASNVTSSRGLYFFATNDNTSTMYDLTATVTVSGTRSGTKTFNVTQAKSFPKGSYIPTSDIKAAGWTNFPGSVGLQVAMPGSTAVTSDTALLWKTEFTFTAGVERISQSNIAQFGMGKANTNAMMAAGADLHPAAKYCRDMGPEWYLPSLKELKLIYDNRNLLWSSYSFYYSAYWSSTTFGNDNTSWCISFGSGSINYGSKTNPFLVRCVREI